MTCATCVTQLTLAAMAAFIHKILCFEVFEILFGQLIDRMLKSKSLHKRKAPPPRQESAPLPHIFGLTGQKWSLNLLS